MEGESLITQQRSAPDLIRMIYSAATDDRGWEHVLTEVDELFDASGSFLCARKINSIVPEALVSQGIEAAYFSEYQDHFYKVDILSHRAAKLPRGRLYTNQMICEDKDYLASEIYQDLHRRQDIRYGIIGTLREAVGMLNVDIGVVRSHDGTSFTEHEARAANDILPHISRSLQLSQRLDQTANQQRSAYAALDQLAEAVAVCSADGTAHFQNSAYQKLASSSRLLRPHREHKVTFRDVASHRLFKQLLQQVMDPVSGSIHSASSDTICLVDRQDRYLVRAQPWVNQHNSIWGSETEPGFMLFIRRAGVKRVPSARNIAALHPVTQSEAEIGHYLCRGLSLDEIAGERGAATSTVRQQVKAMMRKLNCHKQGELIAFLLTNTLI